MKTKNKPFKEYTASEITNHALKLLSGYGHIVWRNNNLAVKGRKFIGKKGASDILGISKDGRFIACEVKKIGDVYSDEQIAFLTEVWEKGGISLVAKQKDNRIVVEDWFHITGEPQSYETAII